jgi:hypothetical protein
MLAKKRAGRARGARGVGRTQPGAAVPQRGGGVTPLQHQGHQGTEAPRIDTENPEPQSREHQKGIRWK